MHTFKSNIHLQSFGVKPREFGFPVDFMGGVVVTAELKEKKTSILM